MAASSLEGSQTGPSHVLGALAKTIGSRPALSLEMIVSKTIVVVSFPDVAFHAPAVISLSQVVPFALRHEEHYGLFRFNCQEVF